MGYESRCRLTMEGRTFEGTALLEHKSLVFRGETRLSMPLSSIHEVHARGESLFVSFDGRRAVLDVGPTAPRWAQRIANPPGRLAKLGITAGMRVVVFDRDREDQDFLTELAATASLVDGRSARDLDAVFVRVQTAADLDRLAELSTWIRPDGAVWVIRAKGPLATVSESESMAAGKRAGLVDVKVVSFSDRDSAEKYVIPVARRPKAVRQPPASPARRGSAPSPGRT